MLVHVPSNAQIKWNRPMAGVVSHLWCTHDTIVLQYYIIITSQLHYNYTTITWQLKIKLKLKFQIFDNLNLKILKILLLNFNFFFKFSKIWNFDAINFEFFKILKIKIWHGFSVEYSKTQLLKLGCLLGLHECCMFVRACLFYTLHNHI